MEIKNVKSIQGLSNIEHETENQEDLEQLLKDNRLIRRVGKRCCRNRRMTLGQYARDRMFGKVWRCSVCRKTERLFKGSFFEGTHLTPFSILYMAFAYVVLKLNGVDIKHILDNPPNITTVTDWLQFFRDVMSKEVQHETRNLRIGGPGKTVVIDETALSKRKYNRGRPVGRATCWVLGMYDVETKTGTMLHIQNRSAGEILPKIQQNVVAGSTIRTDELRTYHRLTAMGYTHETVNHSQMFVAPDGTHTNHIEGYFSRVKKFLRKRDIRRLDLIPSYLDEFLWRERHPDTLWEDFVRALQRQYRFL